MTYNVQIPGFEGREVIANTNLLTGRNTLTVDGKPAAKGPKRGEFLIRNQYGKESTAYFKSAFPDTVPILMVNEQPVRLVEKLQWYELVWSCLPLVLMAVGGGLGGLCGAIATSFNLQVFRSKMPVPVRYIVSLLISFASFIAFMFLALIFQRLTRRF